MPLAGGGELNLLPALNEKGFLDVLVGDETAADFFLLTLTIPEPQSWTLLLAGLGLLQPGQRRALLRFFGFYARCKGLLNFLRRSPGRNACEGWLELSAALAWARAARGGLARVARGGLARAEDPFLSIGVGALYTTRLAHLQVHELPEWPG